MPSCDALNDSKPAREQAKWGPRTVSLLDVSLLRILDGERVRSSREPALRTRDIRGHCAGSYALRAPTVKD
jgi:hypothetical protein